MFVSSIYPITCFHKVSRLSWIIGNLKNANKWTKILTLESTIFGLKMIVRSGLEFFYFRIQRHLLPARPIQPFWAKFFFTGQQQLCSFNSKMKNSRPLFTITFEHGLRTPNEGINQRYLKNWADVADKICFGRT